MFIAGPKYAAQLKGRKLSYKELLNCPCIFLERNTSTRRFMDEFLTKRGVRLEPEFELATSEMIVQFVKRNLGIGCLMSDFASEALGNGDVLRWNLTKRCHPVSFVWWQLRKPGCPQRLRSFLISWRR